MRLHCDRLDAGLFVHTDDARRPLVIHVPGFNEDAFSHAGYALLLAHAGVDALVMNPPWRATPENVQADPFMLWRLFDGMDAQLRASESLWSGRRLGLSGFSMGGLWASRWLATHERRPIDAAALVLASGDYSFMPRVTMAAFPALAAAVPEAVLGDVEVAMRERSPIGDLTALPPMPLLVINVANDPRLPADNALRFHAALQRSYSEVGQGEALETTLLRGDEHRFRRAFQQRLVAWFAEQVTQSS